VQVKRICDRSNETEMPDKRSCVAWNG